MGLCRFGGPRQHDGGRRQRARPERRAPLERRASQVRAASQAPRASQAQRASQARPGAAARQVSRAQAERPAPPGPQVAAAPQAPRAVAARQASRAQPAPRAPRGRWNDRHRGRRRHAVRELLHRRRHHRSGAPARRHRANLLAILKAHGFNYIRLRTFVDPRAADGYDKQNGYGGIDPTVAFGKQVKDAGMGLLIDFHYADNWADPGKQCVPPAWQGYTTIAQLVDRRPRLHARFDQQADRGRRPPRHGADRKREHARHPDSSLRQRRHSQRGRRRHQPRQRRALLLLRARSRLPRQAPRPPAAGPTWASCSRRAPRPSRTSTPASRSSCTSIAATTSRRAASSSRAR